MQSTGRLLNQVIHGDCLQVLPGLASGSVDMIFADPPYFLSNGGVTCNSGRAVSVNKGGWDKSLGTEGNHDFNRSWLIECKRLLNPSGTIWVSGTQHVIFSIGFAMQQLGFKLLNIITWEKPNPPPNLSCRYFTHSTETLIWAAKDENSKHIFNYQDMRSANGGKQMKSVWQILPPKSGEKVYGKHPTQKPLELVRRCILASTLDGGLVLDPFAGSCTTAIAAIGTGRNYLCVEKEEEFIDIGRKRIAGNELTEGLWKDR